MNLHIDALRKFSANGQVYRSYGHAIAARHGEILLVPLHLVQGRFNHLVDGCPVPWEEVVAVLEAAGYQPDPQHTDPRLLQSYKQAVGQQPEDLLIELISLHEGHQQHVIRISHPSGVKYAITIT